MKALGIYTLTARHIQEIQTRMEEESRTYLESYRHLFPAIAHQVDGISRIGAIPPFTNVGAPWWGSGLPYRKSKIIAIIQSLRGGYSQVQSFFGERR